MNVPRRNEEVRAFTIIDLILLLAFTALFLAIALPAILAARLSDAEQASLNRLHSISVVVQSYAEAHRGFFPFPDRDEEEDPLSFQPIVWAPLPGAPEATSGPIFEFTDPWRPMRRLWPTLIRGIAPWADFYVQWIGPGAEPPIPPWGADEPRLPSYEYSNSFLANPPVWRPDEDAEFADIEPVLRADVTFTDTKVIFFDAERPYLPLDDAAAPRPVLFVNGAGAMRRDEAAVRPAQNELSDLAPALYHDTPSGPAGRDFVAPQ